MRPITAGTPTYVPPMLLQRVTALLFLAITAAFLWRFPVWQVWLAGGFAIYALVLLKNPNFWLIAVPAAMPVLDLAVFSGWYFFDEFDALVLLTIAVLLLRQNLQREDFELGWPLAAALLLNLSFHLVQAARYGLARRARR